MAETKHSAGTAGTTTPTGAAPIRPVVDVEQAGALFMEIASIANQIDRTCYFTHDAFSGAEPLDPGRVGLELARLRDAICRIGWMADLGSAKLTGSETIRGDAAAWLLPPSFQWAQKADAQGAAA